jgi:hypothetical protein
LISLRAFALAIATTSVFILPGTALAQNGSGGAVYPEPTPAPTPPPAPAAPAAPTDIVVPGSVAQLLPDGSAAAPADAPAAVQQAIFAANRIQDKPYIYGGGHRKFEDKGYDCSGTVSYALNGGGLLQSPLDSGSFMKWGEKGPGTWITIYTNPGHAYTVIAGLRLDTSAASVTSASKIRFKKALESGPRWRPTARSNKGFKVRHPLGY